MSDKLSWGTGDRRKIAWALTGMDRMTVMTSVMYSLSLQLQSKNSGVFFFLMCVLRLYFSCTKVLAGSPSRGGDVTVYV